VRAVITHTHTLKYPFKHLFNFLQGGVIPAVLKNGVRLDISHPARTIYIFTQKCWQWGITSHSNFARKVQETLIF